MPASLVMPGWPGVSGHDDTFSVEAKAFFARLATQPTMARKRQYDTIIFRPALAAGVLTDFDELCVRGADQATTLTNLVAASPASSVSGSPTFIADKGLYGDGVSAHVNTGFNPTTGSPKFTQNDATWGVWSLKQYLDGGAILGAVTGTPKNSLNPRFTDGNYYYRGNAGSSTSAATTNGQKLYAMSRVSGNETLYINGSSQGTVAVASSAPDNANFTILRDRSSYFNGGAGAWFFGRALSAAKQAAIYNILNAWMAAVGDVPGLIGSLTDSANLNAPEDILIDGNFAYVPCRDGATLTTIDITDALHPFICDVFSHSDLTSGMGVAKNGNTLYVTSWQNSKLLILDCTDPTNLTHISTITLGGGGLANLRKIFYLNGYVYACRSETATLYIVDVSNPASPSIAGSVVTADSVFAVFVKGNYAYLGSYADGAFTGTTLQVVDVSNKASPTVVKTLTHANYNGMSGFSNVGNALYAVAFNANYFLDFDITDPPNTVETTKTNIALLNGPNRIQVVGNTAYIPTFANNGIVKLNIATPSSPVTMDLIQDAKTVGCYDARVANGRLFAIGRTADSFAVFSL